jgi:pimeloyl-ACP methyl ester carboxylesterase
MQRLRSFVRVLGWLALGVVLALTGIGAVYTPNTEIPAGVTGHHVTVAGVPLRVLQRGSGPDVLLIHGSPGCIEDWTALIDALAGAARVTAYDRPGHGYSGDTGQYSYAHNADVALALIEELGLTQVTVVGHSYGGTTVLTLALRASPVIDAYVTVDGGAYAPPGVPGPIFALLEPPLFRMGVAAVLGGPIARRRVRDETPKMFRAMPAPPGFVELRTQLFSTPKTVHALAKEWRGAAGWLDAQSSSYPRIDKPLHILAQAEDAYRRETAERLHRDVAHSSLRLLRGAGHHLQIEKTDEVAAVIRSAIAR